MMNLEVIILLAQERLRQMEGASQANDILASQPPHSAHSIAHELLLRSAEVNQQLRALAAPSLNGNAAVGRAPRQ
jgi:hypothetical protein